MTDNKLPATVASVLQLIAKEGLGGDAEIRCRIKGAAISPTATVTINTHSSGNTYGSHWVKHLEIELDDAYIDKLVADRVAKIFAKLATDACAPQEAI